MLQKSESYVLGASLSESHASLTSSHFCSVTRLTLRETRAEVAAHLLYRTMIFLLGGFTSERTKLIKDEIEMQCLKKFSLTSKVI